MFLNISVQCNWMKVDLARSHFTCKKGISFILSVCIFLLWKTQHTDLSPLLGRLKYPSSNVKKLSPSSSIYVSLSWDKLLLGKNPTTLASHLPPAGVSAVKIVISQIKNFPAFVKQDDPPNQNLKTFSTQVVRVVVGKKMGANRGRGRAEKIE